jgi:hypothetical protein
MWDTGDIIEVVFDRFRAWLRKRRHPLSERELSEEEAMRRQAEQERLRAETEMAEQRQRIESGGQGHGWGGGPGGW